MTTENLPIPEAEITQPDAPQIDNVEPVKQYTKEDIEKAVRDRIKRERQASEEKEKEIADLKKKLESLQSKVERGSATQDEQLDYAHGKEASEKAQAQGISQEELPYIIQEAIDERKFGDNVRNALEEDSEFKKLFETQKASNEKYQGGDKEEVPLFDPQILPLRFEKNGVAILKQLLKDPKDRELYLYALQDAAKGATYSFKRFINDMQDKINSSSSKPRPNNFKIPPNISTVGESDDEFDITDYVKNKRTRN